MTVFLTMFQFLITFQEVKTFKLVKPQTNEQTNEEKKRKEK